jgi:glycine/D-amino acid oxidase-like deaminating enzyme
MAPQHVAVIGAGAFGGWTALALLRKAQTRGIALRVTLVDAYGPGNARASSGGETRVIRAVYGDRDVYTEMVARSFPLWRDAQAEWKRTLLVPTGALWMFAEHRTATSTRGNTANTTLAAEPSDAIVRDALPSMHRHGFALHALSLDDVRARWPHIHVDGLTSAWWEPDAGMLMAREACAAVRDAVVAAGGTYVHAHVVPSPSAAAATQHRLDHVRLSTGDLLSADHFVFACGPWMGALFPDVIGARIRATRQDVLFFGTPAGDVRWEPPAMPIWLHKSDRFLYGIPGNAHRGFKVAYDTPGTVIDPDTLDRHIAPDSLHHARQLLAERFPALRDAPLVESRVCQYESTFDGHLLMDWHPAYHNALLLGGGSGHGFKLGPAVGEDAAAIMLDNTAPHPLFSHHRLRIAEPSTGLF